MSRSMLRAARATLSCALMFAAGWGVARAEDPDPVKQLLETRKCRACDLSGVQLAGAALHGVDVSGANLTNADLSQANLYKAILRNADLTGATLAGADLSGADLRDTKGADLGGATTNEQTFCPDLSSGPCR